MFDRTVTENNPTNIIQNSGTRLQIKMYKIIPKFQSGFRAGMGCGTALLKITDNIFRELNYGKFGVLVLINYSKACDTINHRLFCAVLHFTGLDEFAIQLIKSYLFERKQRVCYNEIY